MRLAAELQSVLQSIEVLPRRMQLETPGVTATTPLLRGVWGAALHDLDRTAYQAVFSPNSGRVPLYILRPAEPDPDFAPALDWTLIGHALRYEQSLARAWTSLRGWGWGRSGTDFTFVR
jgi:hypothetical protein